MSQPGSESGENPDIEALLAVANGSDIEVQTKSEDVERLASELEEAGPQAAKAAMVKAGFHFSGPLPPANELSRYNTVGNKLGARMGDDYLAQRAHERNMDKVMAEIAVKDSDRATFEQQVRSISLFASFCSFAAFGWASFHMFMLGKNTGGALFASPAIIIGFIALIGRLTPFRKDENSKK